MMALTGKMDFLRERLEYFRRNSLLDSSQLGDNLTLSAPHKSRSSSKRSRSLEEQYSELKRDVDCKTDFHNLVRKEAQQWNIKTRTISNNIVVIDGPRSSSRCWWRVW